MSRSLWAMSLAVVIVLASAPFTGPAADAVVAPVHSIQVTGAGLGMYPAFAPGIDRYGLTTTTATAGRVTVTATTSDASGTVLLDGRPASGGSTTLDGLTPGDEISVIFQDAGGEAVHSLVYLPSGFPRMSEAVPAGPAAAPGDILLNLSRYAGDGTPNFDAALDNRGVPRHVQQLAAAESSADLKPGGAPGHYTVLRSPTTTRGRTGSQLVELDDRFAEVRRFETQGLTNTDVHDAVLRPDGSRILLAYEPNAQTGRQDAVIQELDPAGNVVYTWNSGQHLDPVSETTTTPGAPDYAHINSIQVMSDGDILASFRHLSAVLKIAWHDHDGFSRGDVVWRLGGRRSDFRFVDDPYPSGPCAQHSASQLANGHVLIFDNGSEALGADPRHCVDPNDPGGATVARQQTRVTEYQLDTATGTATLVWSYQRAGWWTYFAGSARRMANGNTLIGWAADQHATATEVDSSGRVVWELTNGGGYFAYRIARAVVPDAVKPVLSVTTPAQGATYVVGQRVTPDGTCTDRGGSSLRACAVSRAPLDTTTTGSHSYQATATDGAGNVTTLTRSYVVEPVTVTRPDALVRQARGGWVGNNTYGGYSRQSVTQPIPRRGGLRTLVLRMQNDGNHRDTLALHGAAGDRKFRVKYFLGSVNVTRSVVAGTFRATLEQGGQRDLRIVVTRLRRARVGNSRVLPVVLTSVSDRGLRDAVAVTALAARRPRN